MSNTKKAESKSGEDCGFRSRGKKHEEGAHHQGRTGQIRHPSKR